MPHTISKQTKIRFEVKWEKAHRPIITDNLRESKFVGIGKNTSTKEGKYNLNFVLTNIFIKHTHIVQAHSQCTLPLHSSHLYTPSHSKIYYKRLLTGILPMHTPIAQLPPTYTQAVFARKCTLPKKINRHTPNAHSHCIAPTYILTGKLKHTTI